MRRVCAQCSVDFELSESTLRLLEQVSPVCNGAKQLIPPPSLCSDCRQQRRLAFRNLHHLYRNTCGLTGKSLITNIAPDGPLTVFAREEWLGDGWDARDHAVDASFTESFFGQLASLYNAIPRWSNFIEKCENCDFCMNSYGGRDSYLITSGGEFERCLFSHRVIKTYECVDCMNLLQGELCYECIDSEDLHTCTHLQNCKQCQQCDYCLDCSSCQDCLLCVGLRQKRYCIRNQQYSKEEYESMRATIMRDRTSALEALYQVALRVPHIAVHTVACEQVTGDFLTHCKNVGQGYFTSNAEDVTEITDSDHATLCYSVNDADYFTECYEVASAAWIHHSAFCENSIHCIDCYYCSACVHCTYCFGCIGLKHKQYCILNKQYTKEEYEALVPKIIEMMKKAGEWGEFFPVTMSPFAYNETVVQEYFPMTKEEVLAKGWRWRDQTDEMPKVDRILPAAKLPESIDDIPDDVLNWAIECEATKRPFKIIKQELEFYRKMRLPIPRLHPDERHRRRMALRNPRKLWDRECAKCQKPIVTSYSPERPEIVYCESCYLASVY